MFASTSATPLLALMATFSLLTSSTALPTIPTRGAAAVLSRSKAKLALRQEAAAADNGSLVISAVHPKTGKSHSVVVNGGNITNSVINVHFNGRREDNTSSPVNTPSPTVPETPDASGKSAGDHSIIVDASAPSGSTGGGGIHNSTINLTVISRRTVELYTSLTNAVRSLFVAPEDHTHAIREVEELQRQRHRRHLAFIDPAAHRARTVEEASTRKAAVRAATPEFESAVLPTTRFAKRQIKRRATPLSSTQRVRSTRHGRDTVQFVQAF
ncbi:hypothetical protein RQP46_000045 [Phenoliferia psychrophenolica]